jgi:hypothetical protein
MISVNYLAVIATAILSLFLGFIWYSILFNKQFFKYYEVKMDPNKKPSAAVMFKSFSIFLLFAFFTSLVFAMGLELWRKNQLEPHWCHSLKYAFMVWLGFFLPFHIGKVTWEMKKWGIVVLNGSYELIRVMLMALILWYWV